MITAPFDVGAEMAALMGVVIQLDGQAFKVCGTVPKMLVRSDSEPLLSELLF